MAHCNIVSIQINPIVMFVAKENTGILVNFASMPFTPAHPSIILLFINRKYFSASGLIMGSMCPDFEYFFRASVKGIHGHTVPGLFYFDLPVSLFLIFIFHELVKEGLINNLPPFLQRRLEALKDFQFRQYLKSNFLVVMISILIGAATHILWDGFTHNGTYFVRNFDFYNGAFIPFEGVNYPLWYAIQHFSTFTGTAIMMIYIFFMPVNNGLEVSKPSWAYWGSLVVFVIIFFSIRFTAFKIRFDLGNAVVTSISGALLGICLFSPLRFFRSGQD